MRVDSIDNASHEKQKGNITYKINDLMGKMVVKVILKIPVKDGHGYVFSTL